MLVVLGIRMNDGFGCINKDGFSAIAISLGLTSGSILNQNRKLSW
jgi:hypothetical protein